MYKARHDLPTPSSFLISSSTFSSLTYLGHFTPSTLSFLLSLSTGLRAFAFATPFAWDTLPPRNTHGSLPHFQQISAQMSSFQGVLSDQPCKTRTANARFLVLHSSCYYLTYHIFISSLFYCVSPLILIISLPSRQELWVSATSVLKIVVKWVSVGIFIKGSKYYYS